MGKYFPQSLHLDKKKPINAFRALKSLMCIFRSLTRALASSSKEYNRRKIAAQQHECKYEPYIYTLMDAIFDYEIIANNTRESSMCDGIIIKKLMSGVKGEKKSIN